MNRRTSQIRSALRAGAALAVLTWCATAHAQDSASEDARIARLEAAVASLQSQLRAQDALAAENATLKDQVAHLRGEVEAIATNPPPPPAGRGSAVPRSAAESSNGNAPVVNSTFANGEPGIATADGRFSANFYALVQFDAAQFFQDAPGPITNDFRRTGPALGWTASNVDYTHARRLKDGDEFRRARFGVSGSAFGDFQYRAVFDFGGSGVENAGQVYEAWAQYSGFKPFKLRVGAMAPQQGLADQDSNAAQPLLDRPASADIARSFAAGDTRTAVELFGTGAHWLASGAITGRTVGVVSSSGTGVAQTYGDQLAFVGRAAVSPTFAGVLVHAGVHGQYLDHPADSSGPTATGAPAPLSRETVAFSDTPELRVDSTKMINTGNIDARHADNEGLELAAQWHGLLVQSEYDYFHVQRLATGVTNPHFDGWYVEGSWIVTGEARKYNSGTAAFDAPPVRHPLGSGGIGVVELVARYSDADLNYHAGAAGTAPAADAIRGGDMQIWTAGINWYPNPYLRFALEGQHVKLDRLSPDAATYLTPLGAQIGQSWDSIAFRSQFGF